METPSLKKCNRCKKELSKLSFKQKADGTYLKRCIKCNEKKVLRLNKNKCEHNRVRSRCKECSGASICEHNRIRSQCKECGGGSICEHGKQRSRCKECGGASICEHNRVRSTCKECSGASICEHNRIRSTCKECGGSSICEHGRRRSHCKECGGGSICEHNRVRSTCKECGGTSICEHGRIRSRCKECGGGSICEHNRQRSMCKECGGASLCPECKTVRPRKRFVKAEKKYVKLCLQCYIHKYPDETLPRRHLLKQRYIDKNIKEKYGEWFFTHDCCISGGISRRRPDWFRDCGDYCIIIENDEDQHRNETIQEEQDRMIEIQGDIGYKRIILIRFNPDKYKTKTQTVRGCFKFDHDNKISTYPEEYEKRFSKLCETIDKYVNVSTQFANDDITTIKLFFDE